MSRASTAATIRVSWMMHQRSESRSWLMSLILTAAVSICLNQTLAVVSMQTVETQITSSSNINKLVNQERQLTTNTPNHDHKHHHHHHHHDAQHRSDAPKFYHLNELLYKTTDGNESPQAAALPNFARPLASDGAAKMSQLKPRGMTRNLAPTNGHNADSGESSIEGLVRMMQARGKPQDGANAIDDDDSDVGGADAGSDRSPPMTRRLANGARGSSVGDRGESAHEATIQRKTNLDDDASGLPEADRSPSSLTASSTSSRFRTREVIPRRRRRASPRQAPPKLKSRRVSRNSRRRKLRHGIKPRRRA